MEPYKLLNKLGQGTFGHVYLCQKKHNDQKIVVKQINTDKNGDSFKSVQNEIKILKSLKHPNIIAYYDSYWKKDVYYIIMEYANSGTLYEHIQANRPEYFKKNFVLRTFAQILHGLHHIHQKNIIHRDLKSENIFLSGVFNDVVKIGDFGISKLLKSSDGKTNTMIGTTNYLAPEVCDGKFYDAKSDIWSLGCILYELCAMERMFDGPVSNMILNIKIGQVKNIDFNRYGCILQKIINMTLQINTNFRPTAAQLIAMPDITSHVEAIKFNIGLV